MVSNCLFSVCMQNRRQAASWSGQLNILSEGVVGWWVEERTDDGGEKSWQASFVV